MKKLKILISILTIAFLLTGCKTYPHPKPKCACGEEVSLNTVG